MQTDLQKSIISVLLTEFPDLATKTANRIIKKNPAPGIANLFGNHVQVNINLEMYEITAELPYTLWEELAEIPINKDDCIEQEWYLFKQGAEKTDIWHWLEETFNISVARDLMGIEN